jgi:two-component system, OmpR family, alkaline phosphatase synthesis response regulator PhoP
MKKEIILVVEDDEDILELIRYNLTKEGYQVRTVTSGEEALKEASSRLPDLVLLDLMLPGLDGLEVCKKIKADPKTAHIQIIMVTAKGEDADIVSGLELGADDYVTKPFSPRVLVARVKTVLRRKTKEVQDEKSVVKAHNIVINPGRFEVLVGGKPIDLTSTEFAILHLLARRPGWVFTRSQIINSVRGENYALTDRAVDVQIVGIRKKLKAQEELIETVRGIGYRLKE